MNVLKDVHQVKAFLGCCQQMAGYVKEYAILASPLHKLTKKLTQFPKPWVEGSEYDKAFHRLKTILLDTSLYLHHKYPDEMLFIEVDASDVGWGACAYEMIKIWAGDPAEQARGRVNDTGQRKIIEWISKAWNEHELKLPVFYRETLARLLCLERFRNFIETNIIAGVCCTLITSQDYLRIVFQIRDNLVHGESQKLQTYSLWYKLITGKYRRCCLQILFLNCAHLTQDFFDPTLPAKLQALLKYLPDTLRNHENIRVYAYKDTAALSRHIQQWRTPKNPVSQGPLSSATAKNTFHIGVMHSDSSLKKYMNYCSQKSNLPSYVLLE